MKPILFVPLVLVLAILACSIPTLPTPTEPPTVEPPPVTEPPTTESPTAEPSPTTEPTAATNLTCNELSLLLDPALASGYDCQVIPANTELEIYPTHTRLTLHGYPLGDKFFEPHIEAYAVADYRLLSPETVNEKVSRLQTLTGGAPAPIFDSSFSVSLPFLPIVNAGQVFFSNYQVVPFTNGSGIRFLTEYAQYFAPVNNHDLFYTYQGLTADGAYWVAAILPINHPMLPANADTPPNGMRWEQFSENYGPYITDMVNQLNAQSPASFIPTLTALDALVASIVIQP